MAAHATNAYINLNKEAFNLNSDEFAIAYYEYYNKMLNSIRNHISQKEEARFKPFGVDEMVETLPKSRT